MILIVADRAASRTPALHNPAATPLVLGISSGCLFCERPWGEVRRSDEHVLAQRMRKHESELLNASQRSYSAGFDLDEQAREFVEHVRSSGKWPKRPRSASRSR
jgi:hypothetical protein